MSPPKPAPDPRPKGRAGELVRLNKYMAENGIASRRHADRLILEGEVMVDGEIVTELGTKVDPTRQRVEVDGVVLRPEGERHGYYLLNKPAGVVCTNDARETRPRAIDLVTDRKKGRIFPVGRLDEETVGLLVLTNDGELANLLTHPRYGVPKTYRVTIEGFVGNDAVAKLREGVRLSDFRAEFERVRVLDRGERSSALLVTLREGRNREIRRVFARIGLKVRKLRRVAIGPVTDRGLKVGHWRPLTRAEIDGLAAAARTSGGAPGEGAGPPPARRRGSGGRPERGGARSPRRGR